MEPSRSVLQTIKSLEDVQERIMKVLGAAKEKREQLDKGFSLQADAEEREIMLEIFEKKMQMEFLKFGFLANKISLLKKGEAFDTVEEILQQMNTDRSIYEMENEIFELETAKARHQQVSSNLLTSPTLRKISVSSSTPLTPLQIKLEEVILNPEEQTLVKRLLDDCFSFEFRKANQFVQRFTAHAEKKGTKEKRKMGSKRMSFLEKSDRDKQKDKEKKERDKDKDEKDGEKEPLDVRGFIAALAEHIYERHHVGNSDLDCDAIEIELEQYILPQIYKHAFESVEKPEEDNILMEKCKEFAGIGQHEMNIAANCQSPEKIPFVDSISKLRTIYFSLTPGKQLYGILNAAQSVYQTLLEYHPEVTVGGDDFMDIWLYVVLKANVRKLASVINFVREYANPTLMQGELGYYFSTLELAAAYIKVFSNEKVNKSHRLSNAERNPPFLVCERAKHVDLVSKRTSLSIVQPKVLVKGFRMYVVDDWLFNTTKFHNAIVFHTGNDDDVIACSVVKIKESKFVTVQEKAYYKSFFLQSDTSGFSLCRTEHGVLLTADEKKFSKYFLVHIPEGEYDQGIAVIRFNLTLKRLGFDVKQPNQPITETEKAEFRQMYQLSDVKDFEASVTDLVKDLQIMLRLTGFLGHNIEIDGVYSDFVLRAVQKFQKHFNREESSSLVSVSENSDLGKLLLGTSDSSSELLSLWPALFDDGRMNPNSREKLTSHFKELVTLFTKIGCKTPADPIVQFEQLSEVIVDFQNSKRLLPTGCFTEKTVDAMREVNAQLLVLKDTIRDKQKLQTQAIQQFLSEDGNE